MDKPIYEIPIAEPGSLRPRLRPPPDQVTAPGNFAQTSPTHRPSLHPLSSLDAPVYGAPPPPPVVPVAVPAVVFEEAPDPILAPDTADRALIAALGEVLRMRASDLHLTSNAQPMLRVDGGLRPVDGSEVWGTERVRAALFSLLTDKQRETFERELELDFAYTVTANARFRVNFYQQRSAIGAAFRIIPTEIKSLEALGVPETVSGFAKLARGLVLVTGPTGSGKSTTLAALVDLVNRTRADHIVTVEDPIEFLHHNHRSLVNQREVGHDTHSFAAALKHVLRQDPDVILVGELRDLETISVALTAAETGHLVFATLHTQDAAQTIDRVIDVFPPHQQDQVRAQLAATLQGVVCQTLVKKAGGKGRVVATEVLVTTPAIANLIREGKTYQIASSMQAGRDLGMYTMDQHLAELVDAGKITFAAGLEKAHDVDGFKNLVHRNENADSAVNRMSSTGVDFGDNYSSPRVS
ncbi:MAG: type pilus twitching motility protein PilT [Microbacteriaceae bacterium]|jgi:twitching motility protein PilT|nr:type pilus twitching motility protein PilT [Microbacteriaceae bacterium]